MKKSEQQLCDIDSIAVAAGNNGAVSAKHDNYSKVAAKPEREQKSRVKFKCEQESVNVKRNNNVQYVRNTNKPVRKNHSVVSFTPCLEDKQLSDNKDEKSDNVILNNDCDDNKLKLDVPELCTSLRFANKLLEKAVHESKSIISSTHFDDGRSAKSSKVKVLRKVNIPFEEQMFKDLVDLRFSESDLFPEQERRLRTKSFVRNKEKEPVLSEFYTPSYNEEFLIKPEQLKIESNKTITYKGFSISDKINHWES